MAPQASLVSTSNQSDTPSNSGDGLLVGVAASTPVGFFGTTPVVQPASPAANVHTVAAGSVTSVFVNTTFDGSIGSTAYTVGDLVVALKNLGLIAK